MPLELHDLLPNEGANQKRKRLGRGTGSGHGKTAGRGTKGQKARSGRGIRRGFEGGQLPIQQRLPYKRGFTNIYKTPWEIVNIGRLAELELDGPITPEVLAERGVIRGAEYPVKILGDGELTGPINISAQSFSESAKERIEAAGGTVVVLERTDAWVTAKPRTRRIPLTREEQAAGIGKVGGPRSRTAAAREG